MDAHGSLSPSRRAKRRRKRVLVVVGVCVAVVVLLVIVVPAAVLLRDKTHAFKAAFIEKCEVFTTNSKRYQKFQNFIFLFIIWVIIIDALMCSSL